MKKNFKKTVLAALGCVAVLGSLLGIPAMADNGPTVTADSRTLNTWDSTGFAKDTKNVGRIWTDKSVSKDSIQLKYGGVAGTTISKYDGSDFLVALSAMSSTSSQTTVEGVPLDIVLVLDMSNSMSRYMDSSDTAERTRIYRDQLNTALTYTNSSGRTTYTYDGTNWKNGNRTVTPSSYRNEDDTTQFYYVPSRVYALKNAAINFTNEVAKANAELGSGSLQHQVSVVSFNGTVEGSSSALQKELTANTGEVITTIANLGQHSGTRADKGMEYAKDALADARTGSQKVVIFFTDGEPTAWDTDQSVNGFRDWVAWDAIKHAQDLKDQNTIIYSIGVFDDLKPEVDPSGYVGGTSNEAKMNTYLHAISSNYPHVTGTSWATLALGTRAPNSSYYTKATSIDELNTIFDNIFKEVSSLPPAPTHTDSGNPQASGYITFTDTLGEFMEVKHVEGIVYNDTLYTEHTDSESEAGGLTVVSHHFSDSVTANQVFNQPYSLSYMRITVTKSNTPSVGDTVTVQIPAALLPLQHYDVDKDGNLSVTEAHPVRVLYSVGLKDGVAEAMNTGKLDSVDGLADYASANAVDGEVSFYSNDWSNGRTGDAASQGTTTVDFVPAASNNYYYFTGNTYLFVDQDCTEPLTTMPTPGATYYYQQTHYEVQDNQTVKASTSVEVDVSATHTSEALADLFVIDPVTGQTYIPAATDRYCISKAESIVLPKTGNETETATSALHPSWVTSGSSVHNYLGNNGRITYHATGSLEIAKTVTAETGLTAPDAEFTFQVSGLPQGTYTYVVKKADGTSVLVDAEDASGNAVQTENQKLTVGITGAELTLKHGQTVTIFGIPEGTEYTVTETKVKTTLADGTVKETAMPGNGFAQTAKSGDTGTIATSVTSEAAFTNHYAAAEETIGTNLFPVQKRVMKLDDNGEKAEVDTWDSDWTFTFNVTAARAEEPGFPMPANRTVTVTEKGQTPDFGEIVFTKPGTYVYGINETMGNAMGMSYSGATYTVVVVVTDNGDGTLNVSPTMTMVNDHSGALIPEDQRVPMTERGSKAVFENVYDLNTAEWGPEAFKFIQDNSGDGSVSLLGGDFTFRATLVNGGDLSAEALAQAPVFADVQNLQAGTVNFAYATLTKDHVGNTYIYKIEELPGSNPGVTYTQQVYYVKLVVTYDETAMAVVYDAKYYTDEGCTTAVSDGDLSSGRVRFTNVYEPDPVAEAFSVQKTFTGREWKDTDTFTFTLAAAQDYGDKITMPADSTATIGKDTGTAEFGGVTFHKVGTYVFHVTETAGSLGGVAYDGHTATITVVVENGEPNTADMGKLVIASVTYVNADAPAQDDRTVTDAAAFTNTYTTTPVTVSNAFQVSKNLTGRPWQQNDDFIFQLLHADGTVDEASIDYSLVQKGAPEATFPRSITYDKTGTYVYYIYELGGTAAGVAYDRTVYQVTVTVTDNGAGALEADVAYAESQLPAGQEMNLENLAKLTYTAVSDDRAEFENVYAPSETAADFHGIKTLVGRDMASGEFSFTLTYTGSDADAVAMPAVTTVYAGEAPDGEAVRFNFGAVTFKKAGTYTFEIAEAAGTLANVTYDTHVCTVTVTVTDNLNGQLVVTGVAYSDGVHAEFLNTYYDPSEAKSVADSTGATIDGMLVQPGQVLTYTIDWVCTEAGSIEITDIIPGNTTYVDGSADNGGTLQADGKTLYWNLENLVPGQTGSVSFQVTVDEGLTSGGMIRNEATVNSFTTNEVTNFVPGKSAKLGDAPITSDTGIQVGDVLTFTITYGNPGKTAANVTITDTLDPTLTYVGMVGEDALQPTVSGQTLTWTAANVPAGTTGTLTFQAEVNETALVEKTDNEASVKIGDHEAVTNLVTIPDPGKADLKITKTVSSQGAPDAVFTFQVDFPGLKESYSYTTDKNRTGTITSGGTLTLSAGETATIKDLPLGAQYTVTETGIPAGFTLTGSTGTAGNVAADSTAAFTNSFTPAVLDAALTVEKNVVDDFATLNEIAWPAEYTFGFTIEAVTPGAPLPSQTMITVSNAGGNTDHTASFGSITYDKAGTYTYKITEMELQSADERYFGISYSDAQYLLTVTVSEDLKTVTKTLTQIRTDADEDVEADVSGNAVFNNEYKLESVSWKPEVRKTLIENGAQLTGEARSFTFVGEALNGGPTPENRSVTISGSGKEEFHSATFRQEHLGQSFLYRFTETQGTVPGVTYDGTVYYIKLDITQKHKESVTEGDALAVNATFYKTDENGTALLAAFGIQDQLVQVENPAGDNLHMSFVNTYDPADAVAAIPVQKTIDGREWLSGEAFTFELSAVAGAPMPKGSVVDEADGVSKLTLEVTGSDVAAFPTITYDKAGTYQYHVREIGGGTTKDGLTYDAKMYRVHVVVTAEGGSLKAEIRYSTDGQNWTTIDAANAALTFTNQYTREPVSVDNVFPVSKAISGRSWLSTDTFTFTLTGKDGAPMPADAVNGAKSVTVTDGTAVNFGTITFTEPSDYFYTVQETAGTISGMTYDVKQYQFKVSVTDQNDGTMRAEVYFLDPVTNTYTAWTGDDVLTVTNTYQAAPAEAVISATKILTGRDWQEGDSFTFTLADASGTLGQISIGYADVDKTKAFDALTFTEAGTYTYTVSEVPGDLENVVYDQVPVTVTVMVTDDGTGKLQATVFYEGGTAAAEFNNVYVKDGPNKTVENATTLIDGKQASPGDELKYTIHWVNTTGRDNATVTIVDTIPAGTTYVSGSTGVVVTYGETTTLTWEMKGLSAGASGNVFFTVKVDDNPGGQITNFASINDYQTNTTYTNVPVKTVNGSTTGTSAAIGQVLDFEITFRNATADAEKIVITDVLDTNLQYVEGSGGELCVPSVNDSGNTVLTWTVPNVAKDAEVKVSFQAKLIQADRETLNDATVDDGTHTYTTNVVTIPEVEKSSLTISKTVVRADGGQNTEANNTQKFTFTVNLYDHSGVTPLTEGYTLTIGGESRTIHSGDTIELMNGQSAVIEGLPVGAKYSITEAEVTAYTSATKTGTITVQENLAEFENVYDAVDTEVVLEAVKTIVNKPEGLDVTGQFTFKVYDETGAEKGTAHNAQDGSVVFPAIAYDRADVYKYTIREIPNEDVSHIDYDTRVYEVTVTVEDVNGQLTVTNVTYTLAETNVETPEFINTYHEGYLVGGFELHAHKVLTGRGLNAGEFEFGLYQIIDGQEVKITSGYNKADGTVEFSVPAAVSVSDAAVSEVGDTTIEVVDDNVVHTYIGLKDTAVLTDEELAQLAQGEDVHVKLLVTGIAAAEEQKAQIAAVIPGETVTAVQFMELSLVKTVGEGEPVAVTATSEPVTLTFCGMDVSGNVRLARVTDGGLELLTDLDGQGNDTITVTTQTFGTYVLIASEAVEAEPEMTEPTVPEETQPVETEPVETQPVETEPAESEPVETEPVETQPVETQPVETEPAESEPVETQPVETQPVETEPVETEPVETQPAETQPVETEPVETQPVETEPVRTQPAETEPAETQPTETEAAGEATAAYADYSIIRLNNTGNEKTLEQSGLLVIGDDSAAPAVPEAPVVTVEPLTGSFFKVTVEPAQGTVEPLWYIIREESEPKLGGVTYDGTEYTVKVEIVVDNGQVICKPTYYKDGEVVDEAEVIFRNSYTAEASATVEITGTKLLTGRDLAEGEFTFVLTDASGNTTTVTNSADGSFKFVVGPFDRADTYTYTITERKGSDPTITYDETSYTVKVVVTDDGEGHLVAVADVENPTVSFQNLYTKPDAVTAVIKATKVLTGDRTTLSNGEFTFVLTKDGTVVATAGNTADGTVTFQVGPFEAECEHVYTVTERKGSDPLITYSEASFEVKVSVTMGADGQLHVDVQQPEGGIVFTNTYTDPAKVSATIRGTKTLTGRNLKAEEFSFVLKSGDTIVGTAKNAADGSFSFQVGPYGEVGEYKYTVTEVKGTDEQIVYDTASFEVTVKVTMDDKGVLSAAVEYPENGIRFANTYKEPPTVSVVLEATKTMKGRDLSESEFEFLVRDSSKKLVSTGKNTRDGEIIFSPIVFKEPGVYTLTISEVEGSQSEVTYDDTVFVVVVTVTEKDDGSLEAKVEYPVKPVFRNVYEPDDEYTPDDSNPKTGDSMMLPVLAWVISGAALMALLDNRRRTAK